MVNLSRLDWQLLTLKFNQIVIRVMDQIPEIFEGVFAPRLVIRQVLIASALHGAMMGIDGAYKLVINIWMHYVSGVGRKMFRIEKEMAQAANYQDWLKLAREHDELSGKMKWRKEDASPLINAPGIRRKIREINYFREKGDPAALIFRLSGNFTRNQFGVQHEEMHSYAMSGTKRIIIEYNDAMQQALEYICDADEAKVSLEEKFSFFSELRHAYGRTALLLSGGAYLGYYHMGIFKSLWKNGMLPKVISGASAGSLMAAMVGTKTDKQLDDIFAGEDEVDGYRRDYFKFSDSINSPLGNMAQAVIPKSFAWLTNPILSFVFDGKLLNLDVKHLSQVVIDNVGHYTFQEAFDRTGRIINITVAPLNEYDPPRLLNYLTAPHVCVWSAAVASCAIPGVFDPIQLVVKAPAGIDVSVPHSVSRISAQDEGAARGYSDGSIESDLPMAQLSEIFNANHFIISQVNPHSALFSSLSLRKGSALYKSSALFRMLTGFVHFLKEESRSYLINLISFFVTSISRTPLWSSKRGLYSTITQKYEGTENDITISPWSGHISVPGAWCSLIKNPTDEEYKDVVHKASEAVFSYLPRIKARCRVEMTLEACTQKLKKRINDRAAIVLHSKVGVGVGGAGLGPKDASEPDSGVQDGTPLRRAPSFHTSRTMVGSI